MKRALMTRPLCPNRLKRQSVKEHADLRLTKGRFFGRAMTRPEIELNTRTGKLIMTGSAIEAATQRIYESLAADNVDIDLHIANLKAALAQAGMKEVVLDPGKLVQNNRSGRKLLQAYFRQRGVSVSYLAS
jgi:hypothetical protein